MYEGALKPGDRLPEDELAWLMSVSRTVVREALNGLRSRGLITILPGRGSFIATSPPRSLRDLVTIENITVTDLHEARNVLNSRRPAWQPYAEPPKKWTGFGRYASEAVLDLVETAPGKFRVDEGRGYERIAKSFRDDAANTPPDGGKS